MSSHRIAAVDARLAMVVVFGLAIWQPVSLRRDRRSAETAKPRAP